MDATPATKKFSFEPFAETPEYLAVNRAALSNLGRHIFGKVRRMLDLATGVGTMVQLGREQIPALREAMIICIDASREAIIAGRRRLSGEPNLHWLQAFAQHLPLSGPFELTTFGNGIHNLSHEDKLAALKDVFRVTAPGGLLFFNSAFYEGTVVEGTEGFYRAKILRAVAELKQMGVPRSKEGRAEARNWLKPEEYADLVRAAGFEIVYLGQREVRVYREGWRLICEYADYAAGALHGYPVEIAARVLSRAVVSVLEEMGFVDEQGQRYIPRRWLEVIARKPAG
jgi:ubiquinone/menaquinone biosynthesis C-methylase UbiE